MFHKSCKHSTLQVGLCTFGYSVLLNRLVWPFFELLQTCCSGNALQSCHQSSGSGSHQAGTTNPCMREQKADFAEAWNLRGSFKGTTRLTGLNLAAEVCVSRTQYINQQYSACTLKTSMGKSLFAICFSVLVKFKEAFYWENYYRVRHEGNHTDSIACIFFGFQSLWLGSFMKSNKVIDCM